MCHVEARGAAGRPAILGREGGWVHVHVEARGAAGRPAILGREGGRPTWVYFHQALRIRCARDPAQKWIEALNLILYWKAPVHAPHEAWSERSRWRDATSEPASLTRLISPAHERRHLPQSRCHIRELNRCERQRRATLSGGGLMGAAPARVASGAWELGTEPV